VVDRAAIGLRRRDGWSIRIIARELGRSSGMVCDEIRRHVDAEASHRRFRREPRLVPAGLFSERHKRFVNGIKQLPGLRVSHEAIRITVYGPRYGRRAKPSGAASARVAGEAANSAA